jgi:hypothetical protein
VEKISTAAELFAANDLADPRMIQADQFADVSEREAVLLGLGEGFAPGLPRSLAVALKLLLGGFDCLAGRIALGVVGHPGSLLGRQGPLCAAELHTLGA